MSDAGDDDDFNWNEPMPDQMKLTFAIIEKMTGDFSMTKWKEIAAGTGMSDATAKQRFPRLRDKYLAEMPSLPAGDANQANEAEDEDIPVPTTTQRLTRGAKCAAPRDDKEIETDGENVASESRASKPPPRFHKGNKHTAPRDEEEVEEEDPTIDNPFAKPPKNAKGRTPLPSKELIARRKAAREQDGDEYQ
ncbi:hypothetical protein PG996_005116 [Apiospora saccharicola]|uniref:Myb-like domain-containing protein n=1 Tax=Apiospora saccharicola TaxID=335842 RepID=A0ABR1VKN2_9PEZI